MLLEYEAGLCIPGYAGPIVIGERIRVGSDGSFLITGATDVAKIGVVGGSSLGRIEETLSSAGIEPRKSHGAVYPPPMVCDWFQLRHVVRVAIFEVHPVVALRYYGDLDHLPEESRLTIVALVQEARQSAVSVGPTARRRLPLREIADLLADARAFVGEGAPIQLDDWRPGWVFLKVEPQGSGWVPISEFLSEE